MLLQNKQQYIKDFLQHCLNDINGKISYINYFSNIISGNFRINNLRGTYFECYSYAFNLYRIVKYLNPTLIILSKINCNDFKNIFNIYSNGIIKFYSFLRFNRIYFRGMDKFFKYIYLL